MQFKQRLMRNSSLLAIYARIMSPVIVHEDAEIRRGIALVCDRMWPDRRAAA
jgi:hypothetical protein